MPPAIPDPPRRARVSERLRLRSRPGRGRLAAACLAAAAALAPGAASVPPAIPTPPPPAATDRAAGVDLRLLVKIPMRDGVRLNATLYVPAPLPAPGPAAAGQPAAAAAFPVIFHLSPYTPDGRHREAIYLARRGFAYAAVEVRGSGNSEGNFDFWVNDGRDGYDVAEWLARQPWSNGKVGMWGESYCGRAVWSTLKEGPPHLASAVPIAAGNAILSWNNFLTPDLMEGILVMATGVTGNLNLDSEPSFLPEKYRELYLRHLPLRQLDRLAGLPSRLFQRMLDHPTPDLFWHAITPGVDDFRRLSLPILTITASYDSNQQGALFYYGQHLRYASPAGRDNHYLVFGPWDHHGTYRPSREVGGLTFGPASAIDMPELLAGWFGHTLRGEPLPPLLSQRVAYYVAGTEEWRHADSLDAVTGAVKRLYLASDGDPGRGGGGARDLFHSGSLVRAAGASASGGAVADHWVYDPLDVSAASREPDANESWATDQRPALALQGDGLVYHGAPLPRDLEVIGVPRLVLSLAMDVPDTDLEATLYVIAPDGGSVLLGDAALRARYRHSPAKEELIHPGEIDRYELAFPFAARRMPRGSRLRLLVRSPNSIYWEKNYNSGGAVADESGRDARTAHITLYHEPAHPSWLEMPIVAAPQAAAGGR
jgi:putative CocE/NonD family hydrolase